MFPHAKQSCSMLKHKFKPHLLFFLSIHLVRCLRTWWEKVRCLDSFHGGATMVFDAPDSCLTCILSFLHDLAIMIDFSHCLSDFAAQIKIKKNSADQLYPPIFGILSNTWLVDLELYPCCICKVLIK